MRPIILATAGLEDTKRQLKQVHLYENYGSSIAKAGGTPLLLASADRDSLRQIAELADGLYLTGGEDIEPWRYQQQDGGYCGAVDPWRDDLELQLCDLFIQMKKPIMGICRGLQMINVYFGGTMIQDLQQDRGIAHPYHSVHEIHAAGGSWLEKQFGKCFLANSYHHQAIDRLGDGLTATAFSADGQIIEAIVHKSSPIICVQWHPERMVGPERYDPEGPDMLPYFQYFCQSCEENKI